MEAPGLGQQNKRLSARVSGGNECMISSAGRSENRYNSSWSTPFKFQHLKLLVEGMGTKKENSISGDM